MEVSSDTEGAIKKMLPELEDAGCRVSIHGLTPNLRRWIALLGKLRKPQGVYPRPTVPAAHLAAHVPRFLFHTQN